MRDRVRTVAVVNAGGWGTALAVKLANQGYEVRLWARRKEQAARIAAERENREYLPYVSVPPTVQVTSDLAAAVADADAVVVAAIAVWLGFPILDPIIGILIGIAIVFVTRDAARAIWYRLMDAVDPELIERVEQIIGEHDDVKGIQRLQMRWLGHRMVAEMTLALDPNLSIVQSEAITDHISHHLYHALPTLAEATIAAVPWERGYGQESAHHRVRVS